MRLTREEYLKDASTENPKEILKLELPDSYALDLEREAVEEFKRTGRLGETRYFESYLEDLDKWIKNGLDMKRVHVVSLPLSEYMKYEIECYKLSQAHGEQIYLIERSKFDQIPIPKGVVLEDLLLVDGKTLYLTLYEKIDNVSLGNLIGAEKFTDMGIIELYKGFFNTILSGATELNKFLSDNSTGL